MPLIKKKKSIQAQKADSEAVSEMLSLFQKDKLIRGNDGKDGLNGKDGINGKDGKDGKDGSDGVNGEHGVDGKDGKDGKDGLIGPKGPKGDKGEKGNDGSPDSPEEIVFKVNKIGGIKISAITDLEEYLNHVGGNIPKDMIGAPRIIMLNNGERQSAPLGSLNITGTGYTLTNNGQDYTLNITGGGGGSGMEIGGSIVGAIEGSVLFAGPAGVLAQDNANFFFDDTNNRLSIGKTAPTVTLDVASTGNAGFTLTGGSTANAATFTLADSNDIFNTSIWRLIGSTGANTNFKNVPNTFALQSNPSGGLILATNSASLAPIIFSIGTAFTDEAMRIHTDKSLILKDNLLFANGKGVKGPADSTSAYSLYGYEILSPGYSAVLTVTNGATAPTMNFITTATIGGSYIYRAGGTDVPIADGGTGASSFGANRVPYINSGNSAFTSSANFVFDGTKMTIGATSGTYKLNVIGGDILVNNNGTAGDQVLIGDPGAAGYPGIWMGSNVTSPTYSNWSFLWDNVYGTLFNSNLAGISFRISNSTIGSFSTYGLAVGYGNPAGGSVPTSGTSIISAGNIGVNTVTASAGIHVVKTTTQGRFAYNATNYTDFTVGSDGRLSFDSVSSSVTPGFIFKDRIASLGFGGSPTPNFNYNLQLAENSSQTYLQITTTGTGHTASDGFLLGYVDGTGVRYINFEASPHIFYISAAEKARFSDTGSVLQITNADCAKFTGAGSTYGGTLRLVNNNPTDQEWMFGVGGPGGTVVNGKSLFIANITGGTYPWSLDLSGNMGVGLTTNAAGARIHAISTTTQLRLGYDTSNYFSTTVGSTGGVTFDAVGSGSAFTFSDAVTINGLLTLSAQNIATDTTTGMKIGTATSQKLGLFNATPIVQPTTGVAAATFVTNTSLIANDTATFDGYTIGQVVKALRNLGILA